MSPISNIPVPEIPPDSASPAPPGVDERRALIERVAASDQFSRSVRLRDFLLYVGRQSLKENCPEIHEEEIGIRVFGRPASYDRGQDNIVRVNATELRKRVEAYFAGPGAEEPLVFEIPRGAYKPVFRWRARGVTEVRSPQPAPLPEEPPAPAAVVPPDIPAGRSFPVERAAWITVSLILAVLTVFLFYKNLGMRAALEPRQDQPAVNAFWKSFLDSRRQTDIVMPDDSASIIEDITGKPIMLDDYLSRNFMRQIQSSNLSTDRKQDLNGIFNHNLVTFGAVRAAQSVLAQIPAAYPRYLTLARHFSADELNRSNVVFLGGEKAMPWVHLIDDSLNFATDFDYKSGNAFVRNRNPKPGEPSVFTLPTSPDSFMGYAVIAYLPNPGRTGHVLLLAGTDSDATGAAAAFLNSEPQMEKLRAALHADTFPYFEVVLKVPRVSGTFFDTEPIAWRTYPEMH